MLSRFYKKHSVAILCLVALSFPYLFIQSHAVRQNNNIETWLPKASPVRLQYEQFKREFGVEELVLIGVDLEKIEPARIEVLCSRLDRLSGIRKCWSPDRMQAAMGDMGVSSEESRQRLKGLALSQNGKMGGVVLLLSEVGLKDRKAVVRDIMRELEYSQLTGDEIALTGGPVVVNELDRVGGKKENQKFFYITLLICLGLLYHGIRDWKLSGALLFLAIWSISATQTAFGALGGEMNFILGALPVMVMVFTLEASIHVLHYYKSSLNHEDPLAEALRLSWKPCCVSLATTAIGLFSVSVTDIVPVTQFGYGAALGAIIAMAAGLFITPALVTVMPIPAEPHSAEEGSINLARISNWMLARSRQTVAVTCGLLAIASVGLCWIQPRMKPLEFLPKGNRVVTDLRKVQKELTSLDSIEGVVDFQNSQLSFIERLRKVRELEAKLATHPAVSHTMSIGSFFPAQLPDEPLELMQLLKKAEARKGQSDYMTADQRQWRISARVVPTPELSCSEIYEELKVKMNGDPIQLTGMAPMIEQAQKDIFTGFWQSLTGALVVLTIVMAISLWSPWTAVLAMIPNVVPLLMVYGTLGWLGIRVDIGMMMAGSIALGISVDGTFHFLVRYQEQLKNGRTTHQAVKIALLTTGGPIIESIVVSSIGMLALTLSSFSPTAKFGMLMATLLFGALAGDLILLPAILCLRKSHRIVELPAESPVTEARNRRRRQRVVADKVA